MNTNFNLRDYLFKDRPGEETGQRAEAIITLSLGLLSTALAIFAYRHPVVIIASLITNGIAIFTLIQALRGQYNYLILFPTVTAVSILLVTVVEGDGVHDLLWMGILGLFLLANVYSRNNIWRAVLFGVFSIVLFIAAGVAEINNIVPNRFSTDIGYIVLNAFFFTTIMGATLVVFRRERHLLSIAIQNQSEAVAVNRQLEETNRTLEDQVKARARDLNALNEQLQVKAERLQASSEISQELILNIDESIEEMLGNATRLISKKLGFYHVGIFLLEERREYAVLRAANSKGGQQMLARRHQLRVGGSGIVGYVALTGRPRTALDTSADVVFFNNPDLPETRSELAMPLKYGNSIIGVLDVQSMAPSAFSNDDIETLGTLANLIAIIVKTMQINEEFKFIAAREIRFTRDDRENGFSFKPDGTIVASPSLSEKNPTLNRAISTGDAVVLNQPPKGIAPAMAIPVKLRDRVIGIIHVEASQLNRNWTEDEIALVQAISERAALALDNARLLEDSQRRAAKEQVIGEISTRIGAGTDVESILRTAVRELGAQISGAQVTVEIGGGGS